MTDRRPLPSGLLPLVVASVLWGTTGTAASLIGAVPGLVIGAATMALGGTLLFAASLRLSVAALRDPAARRWLLIGAVGAFAYPLAFYSGMQLAGVAVGNVVALGSGPLFAAAWEWIGERRVPSRRTAIAATLAIAGVVLLALTDTRHGADSSAADGGMVTLGVALALVAGAAYALYTYSSTRVLRLGHPGRAAMGATFGVSALALLPVLAFAGSPLLASGERMLVILYLAIGPMFVAYLLFGRGLGRMSSSTVTTITLLEPVVATLLAVIIVGERLALLGWVGIVLVLAGVILLALGTPQEKTSNR